jgi:hypothetical protein
MYTVAIFDYNTAYLLTKDGEWEADAFHMSGIRDKAYEFNCEEDAIERAQEAINEGYLHLYAKRPVIVTLNLIRHIP